MITFSMRREGQFVTHFNRASNQCGTRGQNIYSYICEIEVGPNLDDHGFILDNYKVQGYFDRTYMLPQPAQSCERIAQLAADHFADVLTRNGRDVKRVNVTISGSSFAGLTATWEAERPADVVDITSLDPSWKLPTEPLGDLIVEPVKTPDLGEADVWHRGTRSYYRARLLKKLTLNEALFDPTDDAQNIDYDLAAEQRAIERIKADPSMKMFGLSLPELQERIAFWEEHHAVTFMPIPKLVEVDFGEIEKRVVNDLVPVVPEEQPDKPEQLLCDRCHKPVELDGGEYAREAGKKPGREDYRHIGSRLFSCGDFKNRATVNGQDYVIKTQPEPPPTILCDFCKKPVQADDGHLNYDGTHDWTHVRPDLQSGLFAYGCRTHPNFATVNGSVLVEKSFSQSAQEPSTERTYQKGKAS